MIKEIYRINYWGDMECSICGNNRWSHYVFIMKNGKKQHICKYCVDKSELRKNIGDEK